jgi:hypothetical protein
MRLTGFLAFALLSISILSYGVSGAAFATSDPNPALPISTDTEIYSNGATVTISGNIQDYDSSSGKGLTYLIISPDNNIVGIGQLTPKSGGSFEKSFVAGGPLWKLNGDYTVKFQYGADKSEVTVNYVGGEAVISKPVEPVEPTVPVEPVEPTVPVEPVEPVEPTVPVEPVEPVEPTCGPGTELVNGICTVIKAPPPDSGCLIATAAYGTELAPQVQLLREIRDNTLFSTTSGTSFMMGFNTLYYSFAPTVADWERENPMFKETVKTMITPMLSTLSIMSLADEGSEAEVLGFGISVIALNLGMYIAAPALIGFKVNKIIKSRK